MIRFPVVLERDTNGTFLVSFPDVPEAHTFGRTKEQALSRAVDCLETALMQYIKQRRTIPPPSRVRKHGSFVALPVLSEAKVALNQAMQEAGVRKAELARRLGWHMPQVDRLLDLGHASRLNQLEAAFAALNKRLSLEIQDAA